MSIGPYIGIVILVMLSAFFSSSEIAYAAVNELRLKKLSQEGNSSATIATYIHDHFDKALTTILIGNNLVNIAASSIATLIFIEWLGEKGALASTVVMTVIVLIFGEITPKIIGKTHTTRLVLFAARPLYLLMGLLRPVNALVTLIIRSLSTIWRRGCPVEPTVTEEELISIIETIEDDGIIDKDRSDLIQSALKFSDIQVQEIFTPRTDMVSVDINDGIEAILETVLATPYTRIPVYNESIDDVVGILHVGSFLIKYAEDQNFDIQSVFLEPLFVHKTMKLPMFFKELNSRHLQMAIVMDEYGGTMGCVTMEDILEELVGDIWDETDEIVDEFVKNADGSCYVSGDLSIRDFLDIVDLDDLEMDSEYTTIGGWVIEMLDGLPGVGDSFTYKNLAITVKELDGMRVKSINVVIEETED